MVDQVQQTEPLYHDEGLEEIMIRHRPSLSHIWPEVLEDLQRDSLINVCGSSGSGKSMFLMELMARVIMRDDLNDAQLLFVDLERKFSVFKLIEICTKMLGADVRNTEECVMNHVKPRLNRIEILTVEKFEEGLFWKIKDQLKNNLKISMVLIDSLGEFFPLDSDAKSSSDEEVKHSEEDKPRKKKKKKSQEPATSAEESSSATKRTSSESSLSSEEEDVNDDVSGHVERLKRIANKFQVSIVSVVPKYVEVCEGIADIKIELTKVTDNVFHVRINEIKEVAFAIGFYGIQIADPPQPQ